MTHFLCVRLVKICAWPQLDNPTAAGIKDVLDWAVDAKLSEVITGATEYAAFRAWAGTVKAAGGNTAGMLGVMNSNNAWLSYALGQDALLETAPTDKDLKIRTFEPAIEAGNFDFTVSVGTVDVSSKAAKENLKKVFGLEGSATLGSEAFSSEKVDIEFGTPVDGKVKFTAKPKDTSSGSFFMKLKMLP